MTAARAWLVACVVGLGACMPTPPPPAPPRHTNLGLTISSMMLGNGLRVVLVRDPSATEVQVTMRYKVGSGDDLERPGLAHLVEHMMFQQVLGAQTLFAHLQDSTSFFNGFTSFDATTYIARAKRDQLDKLLSIDAVRLGFRCTSITDSAFEREREVVVQEIKLRDEASEVRVALHGAVYPEGHPYRQSTGGSPEGVSSITRDEACKFADAYYAPSNAALVVSGNVTPEELKTALGKFIARVATRVAASPASVPALTSVANKNVKAPIDEDALLIAWPLVPDPEIQIGVRTMARSYAQILDYTLRGRVAYLELGDVRAPVVAIAIVPAAGETTDEALKSAQEVLDDLPGVFESRFMADFVFDQIQQRTVYEQYASLEDGSDRDIRLASYVLEGRDPSTALAAEFRGLRGLKRDEIARLARTYLMLDKASVIKLQPTAAKKTGRALALQAPVHDIGLRRSAPDAAQAHAPAPGTLPGEPAAMRTRVLPNGLKVVLLPLSTVPTVDARLVFSAGTADEPSDRLGAALVAARALGFDRHHVEDMLNFQTAGGSTSVDVEPDHIAFTVQGVDMHLDYLLAGLRRWVRDGRYTDSGDRFLEALQREAKKQDQDGVIADAWRSALYGGGHPYARAGLVHYASTTLSVDDVETFRDAHFTPDNATLVIAGHFDAALADRWIDFLFADWTGTATARSAPPIDASAKSLAYLEEIAQMQVRIAIPATATGRAQQLVAAEMLSDIAWDARHQLGASYAFEAALAERRLASHYVLGGWIDPARASEVIELLRDRIATLRNDPDGAARAFVAARSRVLTHLEYIAGGASALARQVETAVGLGRAPLSDLATAREVQALTIEQMGPTLEGLDLGRASILLRGPAEPVKSAFAVLGRTPTVLHFDQAAQDALEDAPGTAAQQRPHRRERIRYSELETSLTEQGPSSRIGITISASYLSASLVDLVQSLGPTTPLHGATGLLVTGDVGLRVSSRYSVGVHLAIGNATGTYERFLDEDASYGLIPIDIAAGVQARAAGRFWGGPFVGLHLDGTRRDGELAWSRGLAIGVEGGVDALSIGPHHFGVMLRFGGSLGSSTGYGGISAGLTYRY